MATDYRKRAFCYKRNTNRALAAIKKMGVRSIFDIIADPTMTINRKVDYIRHHYVYYDGNHDLFHDENGNPNSAKRTLDNAIHDIILGKLDPSILRDFNRELTQLRKERDEEIAANATNSDDDILPGLPKYKLDILNHGGKLMNDGCAGYLRLIDDYMRTLDTKTKQKYFFTKSYREMRKLAEDWNKNKNNPTKVEVPKSKPKEKDDIGSFLEGYEKYAKKQGWN